MDDDGRNLVAYEEMYGDASLRIRNLREALKNIADMDDLQGIAAARMAAEAALDADDKY